jgi:uncharacterized membrane protein YraQ (UPF0718 family)
VSVLHTIGRSLAEGGSMFWETLWALVLGFTLSGAVQAFVSRAQMRRALGDHSPKVVTRAAALGAISSSCSYAASAMAKSLFAGGADFTSSMVFMFASTNLVMELGLVLWILIGWQFALAELVGGAIMIALLAALLPRVVPPGAQEQARRRLSGGGRQGDGTTQGQEHEPTGGRIRSWAGWADAPATW